ncbi:hypothetical protein ACMAVG_004319, partial [Burkholderia cenocepacia]
STRGGSRTRRCRAGCGEQFGQHHDDERRAGSGCDARRRQLTVAARPGRDPLAPQARFIDGR